MHRTARTALVTATAVAALLGAGCTTQVSGTPGPVGAATSAPAGPAAEGDPVAWMDKVCTALLPAIDTMSTEPKLDSTDPVATVKGIATFLDRSSTAVDGAIDGMAAAGPSPVQGGDQAVAALTKTLTAFRDTAREAKTKIDAIDTSDPQELVTALPQAVAPLEKLADLPNPAAELEANPELDAAAAKAPACQKVQSEIK